MIINKQLSSCRLCLRPGSSPVFTSFPLPEYIWPVDQINSGSLSELGVYVCDHCGHIQLPEFSDDFISSLYEKKAYNIENLEGHLYRKEVLTKHFGSDMFQKKKLLDLGGGRNSFVHVAEEAEKWIIDFRIDEPLKKIASCVEGDFLNMPDSIEAAFDFITMFHCMEHVNHPAKAAKQLEKMLRPGGLVILEVPDLPATIQHNAHYALFHQHVNLFYEDSLHRLMAVGGFTPKLVRRYSTNLLAVYKKEAGAGRETGPVNKGGAGATGRALAVKLAEKLRSLETSLCEWADGAREVAVYGGGGNSALFLASVPSLKKKVYECFDRDRSKHGRYLPGSSALIKDPAAISESGADAMVFPTRKILEEIRKSHPGQCRFLSLDEVYERLA